MLATRGHPPIGAQDISIFFMEKIFIPTKSVDPNTKS